MSDEQTVIQLEHELLDAFRAANTVALDRILADDFTFTDPHGAPATKEFWLKEISEGRLAFDSIDLHNLDVKVIGDTALANGQLTMHARSKQGGYNGRYHYTDVYVKQNGHWCAVLSTAQINNPAP
jgi:ketosteroid isomerase-like protein